MPNWKKVIVSGSDAVLNSLNVTNGVTGSLFGTGSWAVRAQSASIADNAVTASRALQSNTASYAVFAATATSATSAGSATSASYATFAATSTTSTNATNATSASYAQFANTASSANDFIVRGSAAVGTTSVGAAKLEVVGNIRTSTYYNFNGNPSVPTDTTAAIFDQSGVGPTISGLNVTFRASTPTPYEIMRIANGGNIGINSTNPTYRLDVLETGSVITSTVSTGSMKGIRICNTITATQNNAIGLWFATGPHQAGIASFRANPSTTWETTLAFYTHVDSISNLNDATEKMRITGEGSIGIGTTSPSVRLHVSGTTKLEGGDGLYINSSAGDITNLFTSPSVHGFYIDYPASYYLAIRGSSEFFRITSGGSVGIGTTNPTAQLHINSGGSLNNIDANNRLIIERNAHTYIMFVSPNEYDQGFHFYNTTDGNIGRLRYAQRASGDFMDFQVASSIRMTINADGNVGIGSTTPAYKLDVDGSLRVNNTIYFPGTLINEATNQTAYTWLRIQPSSGDKAGVLQVGPSGTSKTGVVELYPSSSFNTALRHIIANSGSNATLKIGSDASALPIQFISSNSPTVTISSNGSVGIGTTTPLSSLHIAGSSGVSAPSGSGVFLGIDNEYGNIQLNGNNGSFIDFSSTGTDYRGRIIYFNSSNSMQIYTNGSTKLTINSDGNLGIGSTNPAYTLDVAGSFRTAGAGINVINSSADTVPLRLITTTATNNSRLGFGTLNSANSYNVSVGAYNTSSLGFWSNDTLQGQINANGAFVYSGGAALFTGGSVGIGTTSPLRKLHIVDENTQIRVSYSTGTDARYAELSWGGLYGYAGDTNNDFNIGMNGGNSSSGNLNFWTGPSGSISNRMKISRGGDVGIGTTNTDPLSLGRERNLAIVTTGTNAALTLVGGLAGRIDFGVGTTRTAGIYSDSSNYTEIFTTTALPLVFSTNSSEKMRILSGGNIGINTTAPQYKLHIYESGSNITGGNAISTSTIKGLVLNQMINENQSIGVWFSTNGSHWSGISGQRNDYTSTWGTDLRFYTHENATNDLTYTRERMRISSEGNVGIGTTTPSQKLEVAGVIRGEALNPYGSTDIGSTSPYLYSPSLGALGIGMNGSERVRINSSGNVGIGTTNPTSVLYTKDAGITAQNTYLGTGQLRVGGGSDHTTNTVLSIAPGVVVVDAPGIVGGRFIINSTGNIGINAPSPLRKLHVVDTNPMIRVSYDTGGDARYAELGHGSLIAYAGESNNWLTIGFSGGGTPSAGLPNGSVQISTNGSARMTVSKGGNVGIGTDIPAYKLDVIGSSDQTLRLKSSSANGVIYFEGPTRQWGIFAGANSGRLTIKDETGGTDAINIASGGSVGMGTTAPSSILHVYTTTAADNGGHIKYENANSGIGGATNAQLIGSSKYGTSQLMVWENYGIRFGMRSTANSGAGEIYFTTGTDTVRAHLSSGGTWTVSADVVAYGSPSDVSLKTNIQPLEGALDKVTKLQGVSFTWKDDLEISKMTGIKDDIGFIAQEVQEVLPELVRKNDNGLLSLRDKGITPLLVEAIKELKAQNDTLQSRIQHLESLLLSK